MSTGEHSERDRGARAASGRKAAIVPIWSRSLGHFNTLTPFFERTLRPPIRPATEPFSVSLDDPDVGLVEVTGVLLKRDPKRVVVVIHGLGGSVESGYMSLALRAADEMGATALLLNCRGSDRRGSDIYHSGLTADLEAALSSVTLAAAEEIVLLGYSIGGHIALCYGCERPDPRVKRIAAICSPLDLGTSATDFDRPWLNVYRGHVMDGLKEVYTSAYQRNPRGILPLLARKIRKIRVWDEQVVAPRFGFQSAEHYYSTQSVGPKLSQLKCDALYVGALHDPMVQKAGVDPYLVNSSIEVVWDQTAGHLGFGPDFDLKRPGPLGLEPQVLSWLFR